MTDEEIRARALQMAVAAQAARGISDPRQIVVLAEHYATYIRLGMQGVEGMLKEGERG